MVTLTGILTSATLPGIGYFDRHFDIGDCLANIGYFG
jgi:hypothetical protein